MGDEPERSPAEELAFQLAALVGDAIVPTEDGPALDLDLFTRMLFSRSIKFQALNRESLIGELHVVRDEQHVQRTIATQAETRSDDMPRKEEAGARLEALRRREKQILEQLWPVTPVSPHVHV